MRVGGRIRRANLSVTLKNPIILPKSSHITSLIISHVHEITHHGGRGMTLNQLRASGYWTVSREQKMADLPKSRVEPAPPFTYCSVDFFGPWHVQRGRTVVKRYGALLPCLASRAVHVVHLQNVKNKAFSNCFFSRVQEDKNIQLIASDLPYIGKCFRPVFKLVQRIEIF